jgi:acyl-homoserine lactone synthase
MMHVEDRVSNLLERPMLRSMFEARKAVFADLLKWDLPILDGRFEVDAFDDEHATYIILAGEDGQHLGSARLLPTERPHILGNLFPQLCAGPVPRGPNVYEITRFCLDRRQGAARRRDTRNRLVSALAGFALDHDIHTYTGVAQMAWLQQILAFGWDCRPLGVPHEIGGALTGALAISITAETPALLERGGIWAGNDPAALALAEAA